ncbi:hypothetical protein KJ693_04950 [bacterium]|nr:hypothetical protein [bacterium]
MIREAQILRRLSKILSLHLMAVRGATGLFYSLGSLLLSFLFIQVVDHLFFLPYFVRLILLGLAFSLFLFLLTKDFLLPLLKPLTEIELNSLLQKRYPDIKDDFINALQLSRAEDKNVSSSLIEALIKKTAKESQGVKSEKIVDKRSFRRSYLFLVNVSLLFFSLSLMSASPLSFNLARLFVGNLTIQSKPISPADVISPTQLADLKVEYTYPAYAGLPKKSLTGFSGKIEALTGTEVRLSFSSNHSLSSASLILPRREIPISTKDLRAKFILNGSGEYQIKAKDIFYREAEGLKGYYFSLPDEAPDIKILSPTTDLRRAKDGEIQIEAEAKDDFGLSKILLSYEVRETNRRKEILIRKFSGQKKALFSYNWDLSLCGFKEGEKVRFYLEAFDNDTISGPKKGRSLSYTIEIFSAGKEHKKVKEDLEALEKGLLSLFMEQKVTKDRFKNAADWLKVDKEKGLKLLEEVAKRQAGLQEKTSELSSQAKDLAERMLTDPLEDYLNYLDTSHIKEGLTELSSKKMPGAMKILSEVREGRPGSPDKESDLQQEMVKDLEDLWALAKEVKARQKERDLFETASDISENYLDFLRDLQGAKKGFNQKKEALLKELAKLGSLLNQLAGQLQSLLSQLPKAEATPDSRKIDLGQMNSSFNKLAKSLNSGDMEAALKEAAALAKAISDLKKALSSLSKSCPSSSSNSLCQKGNELSGRLEEIVKREEVLRDETLPLEENRKKLFEKKAQEVLAKIKEKEEQALKKVDRLANLLSKREKGEALRINESLLKMRQEAKEGRLRQSKELSREMGNSLERIFKQAKDKDILSLLGELNMLKAEIDRGLNLGEEDFFSLGEKKTLEGLSKEQEGIETVTKSLIEEMEEFSKKSSLLEPEITKDLKMACEAMKEAKENLACFKSSPALKKEEEALYYLAKSESSLSQGMCQLGQSMGLSLGARPQPQPQPGKTGSSGRFGTKEGYVEIPKKEESLRRGDFQKEILKGLKENFIKDYENLTDYYYKRLTE